MCLQSDKPLLNMMPKKLDFLHQETTFHTIEDDAHVSQLVHHSPRPRKNLLGCITPNHDIININQATRSHQVS